MTTPKISIIRKLERDRAEFAHTCVTEADSNGKSIAGKYKTAIKKLPMMIRTNNIIAAYSFILAKSGDGEDEKDEKKAWKKIYEQTTEWLKLRYPAMFPEGTEFVKALLALDSVQCRAVTAEMFALLTWWKRFVEGLILEPQSGTPEASSEGAGE